MLQLHAWATAAQRSVRNSSSLEELREECARNDAASLVHRQLQQEQQAGTLSQLRTKHAVGASAA
jgi:hypothetical protein